MALTLPSHPRRPPKLAKIMHSRHHMPTLASAGATTKPSPAVQRSRRRMRVIGAVIVAAVVLGLAWFLHSLPDGSWSRTIERLPAAGLLLALVVLPLFGLPISVLYLAVGARWGVGVGLLITGAATMLHLVLSYPLGRAARRPLTKLLERAGWRLPHITPTAARPFCLWVALVPGLSYTLKNYVPALVGIPLRVAFPAYLPVHLATAVAGLALGGVTVRFSWPVVGAALAYGLFMIVLTRHLAHRLRSGHGDFLASSDSRT